MAKNWSPKVLFVATAAPEDEEMRRRIEIHRQQRPPTWQTIEVVDKVGEVLKEGAGDAEVVLLDCLSILLSNLLSEGISYEQAEAKIISEIEGLKAFIKSSHKSLIIVSNEVGMGVVPPYPLGRIYRDLLGMANQSLAELADEVYYLVAGIPIKLKP
jgi:adenosylcobinamide kinase/adenosylcobinamide-phosphate guanylyltransferase